MTEKKYRMLKTRDDKLFFFADHLAELPGMIECELTKKEIDNWNKKPIDGQMQPEEPDLKMTPDEKPGPGYVKNSKGKWVNTKTAAKTAEKQEGSGAPSE